MKCRLNMRCVLFCIGCAIGIWYFNFHLSRKMNIYKDSSGVSFMTKQIALFEYLVYNHCRKNVQSLLHYQYKNSRRNVTVEGAIRVKVQYNMNPYPHSVEDTSECDKECQAIKQLYNKNEKFREECQENALGWCEHWSETTHATKSSSELAKMSIKDQLRLFVCSKRKMQEDRPYSYKVMSSKECMKQHQQNFDIHHEYRQQHLCIILQEYDGYQLTWGGSSFRVTVRHVDTGLVQLCAVRDLLNGSYAIYCPEFRGCHLVTIIRLFTDFSWYLIPNLSDGRTVVEKTVVWNQTLCNRQGMEPELQPGWRFVNSKKEWYKMYEKTTAPLRFYTSVQYNACLKRLNSLTMVGASHLRYFADYIMIKLGHHRLQKHAKSRNDTGDGKVSFLWGKTLSGVAMRVKQLARNHHRRLDEEPSANTLVIMGGAWELYYRALDTYINRSLPLLGRAITTIRTSPGWKKARVIWINNIAFPDNYYEQRNRAIVNVANGAAYRMLETFNVDIFDVFGVTDVRNEDVVDLSHYLARLDNSEHMFGEVGLVAAELLLQYICES